MNILFIGNSYTYYNDLDILFEKICREGGKQVNAFRVTAGGRKLFQFKDASDPVTQELQSALQHRQYEVCFLQEQSLLPIKDYDTFPSAIMSLPLSKMQLPYKKDRKIGIAGLSIFFIFRWLVPFFSLLYDTEFQKQYITK